jgi:putative PEP-CTERM system histidine kinase
LEFTETLAAGGDSTPRAITQAMASLGQFPGALLWGHSEGGGYELLEHWQTDGPHTLEDMRPVADWMQRNEWIIDLQEYRTAPELYDELNLPRFLLNLPNARLIMPLMFAGEVEGILLLHNSALYREMTWEDRDLLKVAGRQAASYLVQYKAANTLVEMRQFEAFNRLSAYVIHDLKNILAQQSLLVANAELHRDNPAFLDDVFKTIRNSVSRMTRLMEQMRSGSRATSKVPLQLSAVLEQVVARCKRASPRPILQPEASDQWVMADPEQLPTVFVNLIENAQQATPNDGHVLVRVLQQNGRAMVEIEDNGEGMDNKFIRDRLFKPFSTTKGLTGMGIGVYECREYVRSLDGDIQVQSQKGLGSCFRVVLPCTSPRK